MKKSINYVPKQMDIISIDFNPSAGREIRKRRPAIVVSSTEYNTFTGFVAVCPITNGAKNLKKMNLLVQVHEIEVTGYVNPLQMHTFDFCKRNAEFICQMNSVDFFKVKQRYMMIFES